MSIKVNGERKSLSQDPCHLLKKPEVKGLLHVCHTERARLPCSQGGSPRHLAREETSLETLPSAQAARPAARWEGHARIPYPFPDAHPGKAWTSSPIWEQAHSVPPGTSCWLALLWHFLEVVGLVSKAGAWGVQEMRV